jgi:hypothetical protein
MFITKADLPSRQFDVEMTDIPALAIIGATTKKDLLQIVLDTVTSDEKLNLTIQDLWFLTVFQRMSVSEVSPLVVRSTCQYPVFLVDQHSEQKRMYSLVEVGGDDVIVGTVPCSAQLATPLTPYDLETRYLEMPEDVEPEFDVPRARDLDFYVIDDRKNWILMHLKPEYRNPEFLASKGQEFLAKLVRFCNQTDHGLSNYVIAQCPDCHRISEIKYEIDVSSFL